MKKNLQSLLIFLVLVLMLTCCLSACKKNKDIFLTYTNATLNSGDKTVDSLQIKVTTGETYILVTPAQTTKITDNETQKFVGWEADDKDKSLFVPGEKFTVQDKSVTFTAVWQRAYEFSFLAGSDTTGDAPQTQYFAEGEIATLPTTTLTKTGYRFDGWKVNDTIYKAGEKITVANSDMAFNALWTKVFSVTFVGDQDANQQQISGEAPTIIDKETGESFIFPQNSFRRDGYEFVCWVDAVTQKEYDVGELLVIDGKNVEFFAKWKKTEVLSDDNFVYTPVTIDNVDGYAIAKASGVKLTGNLNLPTAFDNLPILQIADNGFKMCNITAVEIGSSIKKIGNGAFMSCANLKTVMLNQACAITEIGQNAFWECVSLQTFGVTATTQTGEFNLPSAKNIGEAAFFGCAFKTIKIGQYLTLIGEKSFAKNKVLTSFDIDNLNTVFDGTAMLTKDDKILAYANGLTDTTVNTGDATQICQYAFAYAQNLTTVTFGASLTTIDQHAFEYCNLLTTINQPSSQDNGLTQLSDSAFLGCSKLAKFEIGKKLTNIDMTAFFGSGISSFACDSQNTAYAIDTLSGDALYNKDMSKLLIVAPNKSSLVFDIPNTVTTIGKNAFAENTKLTTITITDLARLTDIEEGAFYGCKALSNIGSFFWYYLESIGKDAFVGCEGLKAINLGPNLNFVGENAFLMCTGTEFAINFDADCPLTAISAYAFAESSLKTITLPNFVTNIYEGAFNGSTIASANLSNTVSIGKQAFAKCNSLATINLPSSVLVVAPDAFAGCEALTSVTVSVGNTNFGQYIFEDENNQQVTDGNLYSYDKKTLLFVAPANALNKDFVLPSFVEQIGESAFLDNVLIESFKANKNSKLKVIGKKAFYNCYMLGTVTLPDTVTQISEYAFFNCALLGEFKFEGTQQLFSIKAYAFANCVRLKLYLNGENMPRIDASAFDQSDTLGSTLKPVIFVEQSVLAQRKNEWSFAASYLQAII